MPILFNCRILNLDELIFLSIICIKKKQYCFNKTNLNVFSIKEILATKVARLEELELVVQNLETVLKEQQQVCYRASQNAAQSATEVQRAIDLIGKKVDQRNAIFRTCKELYQADPSLKSGMYWIDPDGQGIGDDPIYVECDMTTG